MRVVSNTSPISNLAIVGRLYLLRQRYGAVTVPPAVANELRALTHGAAHDTVAMAFRDGWLLVEPLPERSAIGKLRRELDLGEAEAIALAEATAADLLLIDERQGRMTAREHGLKVTGVLGELLYAKFRGELTSMREEMRKLRSEARFFIGADIEQFILSEAGE
jgi:predicted nucleic acid-binding protein